MWDIYKVPTNHNDLNQTSLLAIEILFRKELRVCLALRQIEQKVEVLEDKGTTLGIYFIVEN